VSASELEVKKMPGQHERLTADGLAQGLRKRHVRMIAIGGAIGTRLFLGSGRGISIAGPAIIGVFAVTGLFVFVIMRALGELLLYRPVTGSFAEYAGEFLGPVYRFITGWGYWITWTIIGMAEITAAGIYVEYWFPEIPQWVTALAAVVGLVSLNLIAVAAYGEAEFWFASIKVIAIVSLIVGGLLSIIFGLGAAGKHGGLFNLWHHGGAMPHGLGQALLAFQIVVFAYQGVELIGMAAAETRDRERVLPPAINSIPWRIGLFYVGSLVILMSLFPWSQFGAGRSPFVQAFTGIGVAAAGGLMNFVVLTSALSACSSGLFSNSRLLKGLAADGLAPARLQVVSKRRVPARAIIASGAFMMIGVVVNLEVPKQAFAYISSVATLGAIWSWGIIVSCLLVYRRRVARGEVAASPFKLPLAGPLCWATLGFLAFVTILLGFDKDSRVALYALPIWAVLLLGAYLLFGRRSTSASVTGSPYAAVNVSERAT
jgi:AAT family amino acid transporter